MSGACIGSSSLPSYLSLLATKCPGLTHTRWCAQAVAESRSGFAQTTPDVVQVAALADERAGTDVAHAGLRWAIPGTDVAHAGLGYGMPGTDARAHASLGWVMRSTDVAHGGLRDSKHGHIAMPRT